MLNDFNAFSTISSSWHCSPWNSMVGDTSLTPSDNFRDIYAVRFPSLCWETAREGFSRRCIWMMTFVALKEINSSRRMGKRANQPELSGFGFTTRCMLKIGNLAKGYRPTCCGKCVFGAKPLSSNKAFLRHIAKPVASRTLQD